MSLITASQLRQIAPHGRADIVAAIADHADRVLPAHRLDKLGRLQLFLSICVEETGDLTAVEEDLQHYPAKQIAKTWPRRFKTAAQATPYAYNAPALAEVVYGGRMGNVHPGDGYRYRGRGLVQITGRDNYTVLSTLTGLDLINKPELVNDPAYMLECAAALFVRYEGILEACDRGDARVVWALVGSGSPHGQIINEPAHWQALAAVKRVVTSVGGGEAADAPVHDMRWLQTSLNALGANPKLAVDGKIGPATVAAIRNAQRAAGIEVDGIVGPKTIAAIEAALARQGAA